MEKTIFYRKDGVDFKLDVDTLKFDSSIEADQALKYLKFFFNTKKKFSTLIAALKKAQKAIEPENTEFPKAMKKWLADFDKVTLFTFKEAFECDNQEFKAKIFGTINIPEMIQNLGSTLIEADSKKVAHQIFDKEGSPLGLKDYRVTYETYEVQGEKLEISGNLYVVRCWCDSTGEEHFIWIESQYAKDPLAAIASTFRVPSGVIPYIKEIKRQGDILLCEMDETFADYTMKPGDSMVPLTADQYFTLLTAQS